MKQKILRLNSFTARLNTGKIHSLVPNPCAVASGEGVFSCPKTSSTPEKIPLPPFLCLVSLERCDGCGDPSLRPCSRADTGSKSEFLLPLEFLCSHRLKSTLHLPTILLNLVPFALTRVSRGVASRRRPLSNHGDVYDHGNGWTAL